MFVRLSVKRCARIKVSFVMFTNKDRNYALRSVVETFPGVLYRTDEKRWIDTTVMLHWISKRGWCTR